MRFLSLLALFTSLATPASATLIQVATSGSCCFVSNINDPAALLPASFGSRDFSFGAAEHYSAYWIYDSSNTTDLDPGPLSGLYDFTDPANRIHFETTGSGVWFDFQLDRIMFQYDPVNTMASWYVLDGTLAATNVPDILDGSVTVGFWNDSPVDGTGYYDRVDPIPHAPWEQGGGGRSYLEILGASQEGSFSFRADPFGLEEFGSGPVYQIRGPVVPEPSALMAYASGVIVLAWAGWRRRSR